MAVNDLELRIAGVIPRKDGRPQVIELREDVSGVGFPDGITNVWRYLTFDKFVSLLSTQSLWFSRLDLIGDPFEGATPWQELRIREKTTQHERLRTIWFGTRRWLMVSCWHICDHESDAMWRMYAPTGEGVAIRSTVNSIRNCINRSPGQYGDPELQFPISVPIFVLGRIWYIDMHDVQLQSDSPFGRYFLKREAFSHEAEFRVLAPMPEICTEKGVPATAEPSMAGLYVKVPLQELVSEVVVSPTAPKWFTRAVAETIQRFGLPAPFRVSTLDEPPQF